MISRPTSQRGTPISHVASVPGARRTARRASGASAGAVPPSPAPRPRRKAVPIRSTKARESRSRRMPTPQRFAFPPGANGSRTPLITSSSTGSRACRQVRAVARVEGRQGEGIDRQPGQAGSRRGRSRRARRTAARRSVPAAWPGARCRMAARRTCRCGVRKAGPHPAATADLRTRPALRSPAARTRRPVAARPASSVVAARFTVSVNVCTAGALQPLFAVTVKVDAPCGLRRAADQTRRGIEGKTGRQAGDRQDRRRTYRSRSPVNA